MKNRLNHASPIICGLLLLSASEGLHAATNYVALHSGGTYDGTSWATAFTNVQEAVTTGGANGVVLIAGGTYALPAALTINQTNILVRGGYEGVGVGPGNHDPAQWPTTLSRGGASQRIVMVSGGHDTRLEHVSITGGNVNEGAGVRFEGSSQRVTLTGCTISNNVYSANTGNAHSGGGVFALSGTSVSLVGCVVRDNQIHQARDSGSTAKGSGIHSAGSLSLRDVVVANNSLTHAYPSRTQGAGINFEGVSLDLVNVLISGNVMSHAGAAGGLHVGAGAALLLNCTVADHSAMGIVRAGTSSVGITNSIVWGNWTDISGTVAIGYSDVGDTDFGGSNLQIDPGFEAGYYLSAGSPCIGAGSATATSLDLADYAKNAAGDTYGSIEIVNLGYHDDGGFAMTYPDLYVSTTGSDTLNIGTTPAQAFRSLTKALATAHASTRIHVEAGTYTRTTETFPLALSDKPGVAILGTNAALTRIDAGGSTKRVMTLLRNHRLRLEGLTVTGGSGASGAGLYIDNSQDVLLNDCEVFNNQYAAKLQAVQGGGVFASLSADVQFVNCVVHGNLIWNQHDVSSYRAYGGGIWSGGRLGIRDSIVTNNTVRQGSTLYLPGGSGVHFQGDRMELANSLVADNHEFANRPVGGVQVIAGTAELDSLTLVGNGTAGLRRIGGTVNVVNTILWGNGVDSTGMVTLAYSCVSNSTDHVDGGQNVTGNPLFAGANDYRLQENSSCVNQGLNQPWMAGAFDLAGERRIRAARVDIGAYEWVPPLGSLIVVH